VLSRELEEFHLLTRQWVTAQKLGNQEVPQSHKGYDHAHQARSQHIADIVAGNACASLDSGFFSSSLGVLFGHGRSSPLLTNGFANEEFLKLVAPAKTA
jgi:hypothetical protein